MPASTYLDTLKESFDFLFDRHGYRITDYVDAESSGNNYTRLESVDLVLVVTRDRGQVSLCIRQNDGL